MESAAPKGTRKSFADIVRETEGDLRQRLQAKVPEWAPVLPELSLPARLNVEQCSSSAAARYKAAVAQRIIGPEGRIADLTGGLGVDAWVFSQTAAEVLYNEMDPALCEAVRQNFARLGVQGVLFRNAEVRSGSVAGILDGFRPDLIYLDPARRSSVGRKVFLLEDCSPDLVALQDELLAACPRLLVKVSPMADISLLRRSLKGVSELHVVAVDGECKELLLRLEASCNNAFSLTVSELRDDSVQSISFREEELKEACPGLEAETELAGAWLFEPGAALMKSGCHPAACRRAGLRKLALSTHLYIAGSPAPELASFGRFRQILEVLPLDKRTMAEAGRRHPQADVTARNIPMTSDELRKRIGVRSGGGIHIYGTTLGSRRVLIVTGSGTDGGRR